MSAIIHVLSVPLVPADAMAALKLRAAIDEMCAEDPTLGVTVGPVNEIVLWGQSEPQMEMVIDILKRGKGLDAQVGAPQVRYCETITKTLVWDYTHKRQTGGKGEYAKVKIRFQPGERGSGFVFENAVLGGAIPDAFIPAVERGLTTAKAAGSIAGFPVIDVKMHLARRRLSRRGLERADFRDRRPRLLPRSDAEARAAPDRANDEGRGRDATRLHG